MCKISGRRHPLTPKIKVEEDSLAEQEMFFLNKTLSRIWTVFQYVANSPAKTRLDGRFAKSACLFGSLPASMKFRNAERHQTVLHSSKCPLSAYDCATDVFLNQYFHLRKSTFLVGLSVS